MAILFTRFSGLSGSGAAVEKPKQPKPEPAPDLELKPPPWWGRSFEEFVKGFHASDFQQAPVAAAPAAFRVEPAVSSPETLPEEDFPPTLPEATLLQSPPLESEQDVLWSWIEKQAMGKPKALDVFASACGEACDH